MNSVQMNYFLEQLIHSYVKWIEVNYIINNISNISEDNVKFIRNQQKLSSSLCFTVIIV